MFFKIEGLVAGLNGLVVSVGRLDAEAGYEVLRIYNVDEIAGDRVVSKPIPEGSLWVAKDYLVQCSDPNSREYAHDRPFGNVMFEETRLYGDRTVSFCVFDSGVLSVSILETEPVSKTLFSKNFFSDVLKARSCLGACALGAIDVDNLIFALGELN